MTKYCNCLLRLFPCYKKKNNISKQETSKNITKEFIYRGDSPHIIINSMHQLSSEIEPKDIELKKMVLKQIKLDSESESESESPKSKSESPKSKSKSKFRASVLYYFNKWKLYSSSKRSVVITSGEILENVKHNYFKDEIVNNNVNINLEYPDTQYV